MPVLQMVDYLHKKGGAMSMVETHVMIISVVVAMVVSGFIGFATAAMLSADAYAKGYEDGLKKGLEYFREGLENGDSE